MRRWRLLLLIVLALAVGAGGWWAYGKYTRLRSHLSSALRSVDNLQALASGGKGAAARLRDSGLSGLRDELGRLEGDLLAIHAEMRPFLSLCRYLWWVPRFGDGIAAAPALLDMAIALCSVGWWGLQGVEPIAELAAGDAEGQLGPALSRLAHSRPYFLEAQEALARAAALLPQARRAAFLPQLQRLVQPLEAYLPLAQLGVQGALLAPELLGADGPRVYLLLAQNNHELRPTGGFISAVGLLRVEEGRVTSLELEDSYAVDDYRAKAHPAPPAPLARHMEAGLLLLRDANWSPDFPASAEVIAAIYQMNRGAGPLHGVIAADLTAVELLVKALSPLELPGYGEKVTGDNFLELLQRYWAAPLGAGTIEEQFGSDWWEHRKDILGDLLGAALRKVQADPGSLDLPKLLQALLAALEGRHLQIYLRDAQSAQALAERHWDGALRDAPGDYLLVVDANLGFNKVDPNVERRIEYTVDLSADPPLAQVLVVYSNRSRDSGEPCVRELLVGEWGYRADSYADLMEDCYWDYLRVYAPRGSRLLSAEGADEPVEASQELGKAVFGTFLVVPAARERAVRLVYELPKEATALRPTGRYRLLVQKQAGSRDVALRVRLKLPEEAWPLAVQPRETLARPGEVLLETSLAADCELAIAVVPAQRAPEAWLAAAGAALLVVGLALRLSAERLSVDAREQQEGL